MQNQLKELKTIQEHISDMNMSTYNLLLAATNKFRGWMEPRYGHIVSSISSSHQFMTSPEDLLSEALLSIVSGERNGSLPRGNITFAAFLNFVVYDVIKSQSSHVGKRAKNGLPAMVFEIDVMSVFEMEETVLAVDPKDVDTMMILSESRQEMLETLTSNKNSRLLDVFTMRFLLGLSKSEIAIELNVSNASITADMKLILDLLSDKYE